MVHDIEFKKEAARGKMDLVVDINFRMDTSALYSDIVLPTASWYEKADINSTDMHTFIHPLSESIPALGALIGLILLVKRRLTYKTLLVVTNKMDMVIYTVLFVQILSGLGVAFFVRWGSSWFASALTPYLRSVFTFNPDTSVLASAPIFVQLHVISAFLIIALIPFSRFMHFLVAPVDYLWRKYQIVVWNWNRKSIRQSTKHTFGKRPRNH